MTDIATKEQALQRLDRLVGSWSAEAEHRVLPGETIHGAASFEWLEGGGFLIQRSTADHPDFPNGITIIGWDEDAGEYVMHYFDSRGVTRRLAMSLEGNEWKFWRDDPDFSQRFAGEFSEDGKTITGQFDIAMDGVNLERDMVMTYRKTA